MSVSREAVALEWQQQLWLLPSKAAADTLRGTHVVSTCLSQLGISGRIRWIEGIGFDPHQEEIQFLAVVDVTYVSTTTPLQFTPLDRIDIARAMIDSQACALRTYIETPQAPASPHDLKAPTTWDQLNLWIARELKARGRQRINANILQHAASPDKQVMTVATDAGRAHIKTRTDLPFTEAEVNQYLENRCPAYVAKTLAYDRERGWWLMDDAPGTSLGDEPSLERALKVVDALASLQHDTLPVTEGLIARGCHPILLEDLLRSTTGLLHDWPRENNIGITADMLDALKHRAWVIDELTEAVATLQRSRIPETWLHTDLAGSNVLIDTDRVTFIDLDACAVGPAPLALFSLLHNLPTYVPRKRLVAEDWNARLKDRYADAWSLSGWKDVGSTLRAAKLVLYALRTCHILESADARRLTYNGEALRASTYNRAAGRLAQAVWSAILKIRSESLAPSTH